MSANSLIVIALAVVAYLSGALPWSVWLGRMLYRRDVRAVADGNPGAANAYRVGGWRLGVAVTLLDFFKAFIPVFVAKWGLQLAGEQLLWIGLMPTVGHAFSVFLRFRGGRAIVTLFGVWSGLTLYAMPLVMGAAAIIAMRLLKNDLLRTLAIPAAILLTLLAQQAPGWMLALAAGQLLVILAKLSVFYWTHRRKTAVVEIPFG